MNINFEKATFKDFENIPDLNMIERADVFYDFIEFMKQNDHLNYRLTNYTASGPEIQVVTPYSNGQPKNCISFVSNDYLNFSQHPLVVKESIDAIQKYGTGSGASPLIGGFFKYHEDLENKLADFFYKPKNSVVTFTTGYTANSSTLLSLLQKEDIAIVDMAVHTSVYEGLLSTNKKTFLHNDMESLERVLRSVESKYRTKLIIVDGVYSQDGDLAPINKIVELARHYNAFVMVDDAHGIGVIGKNGRGVLEIYDALENVDIITGTLSKAFANIGGFVVASEKLINFIKFKSRQNIFSATATPAIAGVLKALDLIDEEPHWRNMLQENSVYLKNGFKSLGLNIGNTESPIIPVKIGDPHITGDIGKILLKEGIFTNPILYPAVAKKDARIRISLMATHKKEHLDKVLNIFEDLKNKFNLNTM